MRLFSLVVACGALGVGCVDKGAEDPGEIVREEIVTRVGPPSRASSRTVRCGCDLDGELHIRAPQGSVVTVPDDAEHPSEAEVVLPDDAPVPLRRTKSLGFVGDGKLTQLPTHGGPWNVPDALLPPHRHVETRYPSYGGYRSYGGYGRSYGGYGGYGGAVRSSTTWTQTQTQSGGGSQSQSSHTQVGPGWR